ncbi:MAG: hypothetical protein M3N31_07040, partial [Actinomycetota bacterium]|nr:hypothetical protein [Actinomycetota bacterium]
MAQRGALVPPRWAHRGRSEPPRRPARSPARRSALRRLLVGLAVKPEVVGPHARLGVVWAVVT